MFIASLVQAFIETCITSSMFVGTRLTFLLRYDVVMCIDSSTGMFRGGEKI